MQESDRICLCERKRINRILKDMQELYKQRTSLRIRFRAGSKADAIILKGGRLRPFFGKRDLQR